jgi:hypothetical protein
VLAILCVLLADLWDRWYYSRDLDYFEGELWSPRWIQWGSVLSWSTKRPLHRYFVVRLPSWEYAPVWYHDPYEWVQRAAVYFGRFPPYTIRGRWFTTWCAPRVEVMQ